MAIDFKKELNAEQFEGVFATEGPVLVLAGAGSGKTRMLTYKIAYLVEEAGIDPRSILAVTFTNKAANEMRERVQFLLGSDIPANWLGTFHSICGKILRIDGEFIGIPNDYIIYDAEDSLHLLREIIYEFGFDVKAVEPKKVANAISRLKRRSISPHDFKNIAAKAVEKIVSNIYSRYDELLRRAKAVDFDDMISLVVKLFSENDDVRKKYSQKFQYILVDEFQDTNESQFALLRHLTVEHKNITVVGDDDQSIYSWRGAQIKNILEFPKHYPGCKIIRLEQNYRSTGHILAAASGVIANNRMRHHKKLFTDIGSGEQVDVVRLPDERAEARFVVDKIEQFISQGILPGDIAVLYRINALSRIFEQEFRSRDMPYVVVGGVGFYERAEIKDIIAYLRLIVNPDDDVAFRRVVNKPRRGIGITSVNKIAEIASQAETSILGVLDAKIPVPIQKRAKNKIDEFCAMLDEFRDGIDSVKPSIVIQEILERTGYLKMLSEDQSLQAQTRIENIGQLIAAAQEFESENPEATVQNFLSSITLMTDVDRWSHSSETVNLMTVHAAKGLEFDAVFIAGAELGIFPLARALQDDAQLEEERRLFYVALTRAKRHATICFVSLRSRFGSIEEMGASPFVKELPHSEIKFTNLAQESSIMLPEDVGKGKAYRRASSKDAGAEFVRGMKVHHPFFGAGIVMNVRGSGERTVVTVDFKKVGRKKLVAKFAKLKRI